MKIIGKGAFANGNFGTINIPESVEKIEEGAFKENNLKDVEIPHSVTDIDNESFKDNKLENVIIKNKPENVQIGNGAFDNNGSNGNTTLTPKYKSPTDKDLGIIFDKESGKIISIDNKGQANSGNTSKPGGGGNQSGNKVLTIPPTITIDGKEYPIKEIDKGAHQGEGLISVNLPEGLEEIGDYAFAGNQLIGINMPDSVKKIGNYAFAYNEINTEPTMNFINIQNEEYINKVGKIGDIEENGSKVEILKGMVKLLDQIFVNSFMKFEIPEDYNPISNSSLKIKIDSESYIHDNMDLIFSYEYDGEVVDTEWELNGELMNKTPNGRLSKGTHTIRLRVSDESGKWTNWVQRRIVVREYIEYAMNNPNSGVINDVIYDLGNDLTFTYNNNNNFDWIVPISGVYKIDALGAGAGGRGAKTEGEIKLTKGDIVNFKIHSQGKGGGAGGKGSSYTYGQYQMGYSGHSGSGGTIIKHNNNMVIAAGGSGGMGAKGKTTSGTRPNVYPVGKGGSGGNGGNTTGSRGGKGTNSRGNAGELIGGSGGAFSSVANGGFRSNVSNNLSNHTNGNEASSPYDGAGGGGSASGYYYYPSAGGGGGAGGRSFIDTSLISNHKVTIGHNSSHGKVTLTLIENN